MKKLLLKVGVILVVALVLVGVAGSMLFGPASKAAVAKGARAGLGVDAELGGADASIGPGTSSLTIHDLVLENPDGIAAGAPFLRMGALSAGVKTFSVLSSTVKVPQITLDGLDLRLVQAGTRSNVREILAHVQGLASGAPAATEQAPAEEAAGGGKTLWVGDLRVTGVSLTAELSGLGALNTTKTFAVPDFELNVASAIEEYLAERQRVEAATGVTVAELSGILVNELVARGLDAAEGELPPEVVEVLRGGFTGLEGRAKELLDQHLEGAQAQLEGLVEERQDELTEKANAEKDALEQKLDDEKKTLEGKAKNKLKDLLGGDG